MELGKKYFCQFTAQGKAEDFAVLAGQNIPFVTITGIGQVIQKDIENRLCIVGDLKTRVEHVVRFEDMTNIEEIQ